MSKLILKIDSVWKQIVQYSCLIATHPVSLKLVPAEITARISVNSSVSFESWSISLISCWIMAGVNMVTWCDKTLSSSSLSICCEIKKEEFQVSLSVLKQYGIRGLKVPRVLLTPSPLRSASLNLVSASITTDSLMSGNNFPISYMTKEYLLTESSS